MTRSSLSLAMLLAVSGCGVLGLGAAADLTRFEVAGRYEFTEYTLDPVSDAVRDTDLRGDVLPDDLTLLLREDGTVSLQRTEDGRVGETLTSGTYTISGRTVTVDFSDAGAVDDYYMPDEIAFEGGDRELRAEVLLEGINLERISDDYRGVTRADARLRVRLREIG